MKSRSNAPSEDLLRAQLLTRETKETYLHIGKRDSRKDERARARTTLTKIYFLCLFFFASLFDGLRRLSSMNDDDDDCCPIIERKAVDETIGRKEEEEEEENEEEKGENIDQLLQASLGCHASTSNDEC